MTNDFHKFLMSNSAPPAYLILDTESVPDGKLLGKVRFPDETLTPEEAVSRAQADARSRSHDGSDFLPVTFQYPVAICVIRVGSDFVLRHHLSRCAAVPAA